MNAEQHAMKHMAAPHISIGTYFSAAGLILAVLAGLAAAIAGPGSRMEWWHFRTGFAVLTWAGIGGAAAAAISLVGGVFTRPAEHREAFFSAIAGMLIGLSVAAVPWSWMQAAGRAPKIHDITTDTTAPPQFAAVLPLRADAVNPADYGGPVVAAQQRAAYPDIGPVILPLEHRLALEHAVITAHSLGWEVAATDAAAGRLEASATTFWFGFVDDIVVRVTPVPGGSRIDVRSVSRIGLSDMGTNADRIRKYLRALASTSIIDPDWGG